jgi:hypothetical protein
MTFPNIFRKEISDEVMARVQKLDENTKGKWGKMNATQMLAHCNVTYEMVYENKHPKPNFFMGFILKTFVKKIVTGSTPYKQNAQTAPAFIIKDGRDFEIEKKRLLNYIIKTQKQGENSFDNKVSHSFGKLSKNEWNTMFYKHLDYHLGQFGV